MKLKAAKNSVKNVNWYRQGGEAKPMYALVPSLACLTTINSVLKMSYKVLIIYLFHRKSSWYFDEDHLLRMSKTILRRCQKDKKYLEKLNRAWQKDLKEFYVLVDSVNAGSFKDLTNNELLRYFDRFYKQFLRVWAYFIFIDTFDPHADKLISKFLKMNGVKLGIDTIIAPKNTYVLDEKLDFLKIARAYLMDKKKNIEPLLAKHQQKYYWISNNYGHVTYLTVKDFYLRLSALLKDKKLKELNKEIKEIRDRNRQKERERILKKLPKKVVDFLTIFSDMAFYRDERKRMNMVGITAMRYILFQVSKRLDIDLGTLEYYAPWELKNIFKLSRMELFKVRERKESCLWYFDGDISFFAMDEAKELADYLNLLAFGGSQVIKGMVASPGKVKGKVKVITLVKEFNKMKAGEILVTQMTRPEFTPILKKAAAIVTDEGGITSHAAIVSRELKIPCIIGTKNATEILKDGDMVEVDAEKGEVRRL